MKQENKAYLELLKKRAGMFESLKNDERFIAFKEAAFDDRYTELMDAALALDLSTTQGQKAAITLLVAAKETKRIDAIFQEMEHYSQEAERLLSEPSTEG